VGLDGRHHCNGGLMVSVLASSAKSDLKFGNIMNADKISIEWVSVDNAKMDNFSPISWREQADGRHHCNGGLMVSVLASSAVDRGFEWANIRKVKLSVLV
jgi:hypothetical protein